MFFFSRLLPQFLRNFRPLGPRFRGFHELVQRMPLFFRVKVRDTSRRVVQTHTFTDPPVALSRNVTGGKVQQRRLFRSTDKLDQVIGRVHVDGQRIPQVRIEIRQPRAVDDDIQLALQTRRHFRIQPQSGLRYIAFNDFHPVGEKRVETIAVAFKQRIENRRLLDHFFETRAARIRLLSPDQQIQLPNLRQIQQHIREPHLADKSRNPDQQDASATQCLAYRKRAGMPSLIKINNRTRSRRRFPIRRNCRPLERPQSSETKRSHPACRALLTIGPGLRNPGKQSSRTNDRTQQSSGRHTVAKLQAIRNDPPHTHMPRQRTHHVIQPLAYQHHFRARILQRLEFLHSFFFQERLQLVLKFFFSQQIEPVPGDPTQYRVDDPRRRLAVQRIEERPQRRRKQNQPSPQPTRRKSLAVPGKKGDGPGRG